MYLLADGKHWRVRFEYAVEKEQTKNLKRKKNRQTFNLSTGAVQHNYSYEPNTSMEINCFFHNIFFMWKETLQLHIFAIFICIFSNAAIEDE